MPEIDVLKQKIEFVEKNSKDRWQNVEKEMSDIKQQLADLPDEIVRRMNETTDLKISVKISELDAKIERDKNATQKWIIGIAITAILSLIGTLITIIWSVAQNGGIK
jgi:hypothetical protein